MVLLSAHDQETHRTRFILAQHYFRVPLTHGEWVPGAVSELRHRLIGTPHPLSMALNMEEDGDTPTEDSRPMVGGIQATMEEQEEAAKDVEFKDDALMHLWYVSTPFEVVCVMDSAEEDEDGMLGERPRPLVAVDFGHAVWVEFVDNEDDAARPRSGDSDAKWLRFVTFPPFSEDQERVDDDETPWVRSGGEVRTLEIPDELDLDSVETINIDQSQGAVILSVRDGQIFILCYE